MNNWESRMQSIIEIRNEIMEEKLVIRPFFQRRAVWSKADKENFIDTILRNLPFPEVFFWQGNIDTTDMTYKKFVVDGQQRINTILEYMEDKFSLTRIKRYSELSKTELASFLQYRIVIRLLVSNTEEEIKDIFDRLNKTDYSLNTTEMYNAKYQGMYMKCAKKIADQSIDFLSSIFADSQLSRMQEVGMILQIMTTLEEGIFFASDSSVEKYLSMYNDEYKNDEEMSTLITAAIFQITKLNLEINTIWYKRALLFSLIIEVSMIIRENADFDLLQYKDDLVKYEKFVLDHKDDISLGEVKEFYMSIYQGTASKKSREIRSREIRNLLKH